MERGRIVMKKIVALFGVALGGLALFLLLSDEKSFPIPLPIAPVVRETAPAAAATPIIEDDEVDHEAVAAPLITENSPSEEEDTTVLVTRVVDGDTIEIEGGEKVRYIGVNTPESVDPRRKVQCFGKEASAYNKKLVEAKRVRLEPDAEDRDKYHRLLRYVWIGDTMINEKLVQDGYAQVMTIPPNVKYVERFRIAQIEARELGLGLWEKCKK